MRSTSGQLYNLNPFQLNLLSAYIFKQPQTATEECWHDIHVELILATTLGSPVESSCHPGQPVSQPIRPLFHKARGSQLLQVP